MVVWRLSLSRYKYTVAFFSVSLLFNFRPLFVNCLLEFSVLSSFNNCWSCAGHWSVTTGHWSVVGLEVILVVGQGPFTRFG